jgi:hypothetical protein
MIFPMASLVCVIRICLEIVGAITIVSVLGWAVMQAEPKDLANRHNANLAGRTKVPQKKMHTEKRFHRPCGVDDQRVDSVETETEDQSREHKYSPVVEPTDIDTGRTNVTRNNIEKLSITYPAHANADSAFVNMLGVRGVTLNPELRSHNWH